MILARRALNCILALIFFSLCIQGGKFAALYLILAICNGACVFVKGDTDD